MTLVENILALAIEIAGHIKTRTIPEGGAPGEVLGKTSADNYQVGWVSASGGSGNAVQYVSQTLTTEQKLQACVNLGIGDPDTDLLTYYNNA